MNSQVRKLIPKILVEVEKSNCLKTATGKKSCNLFLESGKFTFRHFSC